jgi:succinate dehydrogenase hydrophobic anchor subunit
MRVKSVARVTFNFKFVISFSSPCGDADAGVQQYCTTYVCASVCVLLRLFLLGFFGARVEGSKSSRGGTSNIPMLMYISCILLLVIKFCHCMVESWRC